MQNKESRPQQAARYSLSVRNLVPERHRESKSKILEASNLGRRSKLRGMTPSLSNKGVGHIEIILAFLLFTSATFLIFSILNVRQGPTTNDSSLRYVAYELKKAAQTEVLIYSVVININTPESQDIIAIELPEEIPSDWSVRVENYSGLLLPSSIAKSDRRIVYVNRSGSNFFYIAVSKDIPDSRISFSALPSQNKEGYSISSTKREFLLSEKNVRRLNTTYYQDYEGLKRQLKLSGRLDFTFELGFGEEDFIKAAQDIPKRTNVAAEKQRQKILRETGEQRFADFEVIIW